MAGSVADEDIRGRLAGELAELGRRLDAIRTELLRWQASSPGAALLSAAPAAPPGPQVSPDVWQRQSPQPWQQPAGPASYPQPPPVPGWGPPPSPPPAPSSSPQPHTPPQPGRILAWTGGAITLVGVVMFLVLAASRGWFGPLARVVAGGLLGLALVGVGLWLHRKPGGRTGALAVVGTGVAALYLDVAAATALYEFLPIAVGLALALTVAAGGLVIAHRWSSELLACGVVLGAAVLAPAITQAATPLLVGLVLALQLAAAAVVWRRGWFWLAVISAWWPVLYSSLSVTLFHADLTAVITALLVLVIGAGLAVLAAPKLPAPGTAGLMVAAPVPSMFHALAFQPWQGALIAGGAGALMVCTLAIHRLPQHARLAAAAAGSVALFEATAIAVNGATLAGVLLGEALVLTVLAAATCRRFPLGIAIGYGAVGLVLALVRDAPLDALVRFPQWPYLVGGQPQTQAILAGLVLSTVVVAAAAGFLSAAARVGWIHADSRSAAVWGPVSAIALYGAAGMVITTALLIMPQETGFRSGHAVVTVSWTLAALALLARGIRRTALRVAGMTLVVAAVAKLVLFDLVALDGLARVGAFLGAGLVLLAAGARYARLIARAREAERPGSQDNPAASTPPAG